jgi:hypothetical protein
MIGQTESRENDAPVFPIAATIAGVAVVTIPASDYAEVLDCRQKVAESIVRDRAFKWVSKSPIERDPEVAMYLASRFGLATVIDIRRECLHRFGAARTPTRSSIFRYWGRLRGDLPT